MYYVTPLVHGLTRLPLLRGRLCLLAQSQDVHDQHLTSQVLNHRESNPTGSLHDVTGQGVSYQPVAAQEESLQEECLLVVS